MSSSRGRSSRSNMNDENERNDSSPYDLRSVLRPKRRNPQTQGEYNEQSVLNLKRSWAELMEAKERARSEGNDDNSVSSPLKNLSMESPVKRYFNDSLEKLQSIATRSNTKRVRNVESNEAPDFIPVSPSSEGVKRRLGWSRTNFPADNLSTTSSSTMCSSDNDLESERASSKQYETDNEVLKRRQKQIDYGKNTKGYRRYIEAVPKNERQAHDIFTPKKNIKYSRRSWDSQIKLWRKRLHEYDDPKNEEEDAGDVDLSDLVGLDLE